MPIFEYRCRECGHVTSFLEKADSRRKHPCEKCGSTKTEKAFSTFSANTHGSTGSSGGSCPTGTCPFS
ncbi:MAG: FmdB family zinc ribbon protein [Phycisphaerae bacterium]